MSESTSEICNEIRTLPRYYIYMVCWDRIIRQGFIEQFTEAMLSNLEINTNDRNKKTVNPYKKGLKRLELRIIKRILTVLSEGGSMRKTNLALKSNLSHRNCTLYLEWLDLLDLINSESNSGNHVFSISMRGRELYLQKFGNQIVHVKSNVSVTDSKQIMLL